MLQTNQTLTSMQFYFNNLNNCSRSLLIFLLKTVKTSLLFSSLMFQPIVLTYGKFYSFKLAYTSITNFNSVGLYLLTTTTTTSSVFFIKPCSTISFKV